VTPVDTGRLTERFAELVSRPETQIPLDEAALVIAGRFQPGIDIARELRGLDHLAAGCFAPTLDALVAYLFSDLGFAGNRLDYYDPSNSYLDQVVARRVGIPITLGVLTIVVGRRLGVPLVGVGLPGHFVLRDRVDPTVFVDPFSGGLLLDRQGCIATFHAVHGPDAPFDDDYLKPVGTVAILTRLLANLRGIFAARSDRAALVGVLELRVALPSASAEDRCDLAGALASAGRFADAARHFDEAGTELGGSLGREYRRNAERLRARLN
jgi:Transglutaminase-like superfamily